MAVIKEIKISIVSDGKELEEYDPPAEDASPETDDSHDDTQVKYIQGISGARFTIRLRIEYGLDFWSANMLWFEPIIDGKRIRGKVIPKEDYMRRGGVERYDYRGPKELSPSGTPVRHLFRWANLISTEESCSTQDKGKYQNLGTIKLEVWRYDGGKSDSTHLRKVWRGLKQEPVPENALKGQAINLRTNFDISTTNQFGKSFSGKKVDKRPYATFIFKYRSKESLEALGLLKRPQATQPEEQRDVEVPSRRVVIKKENDEINLAQVAGVKREREDSSDEMDEVKHLSEQPVKRTRN